jgi:hypothetical protein
VSKSRELSREKPNQLLDASASIRMHRSSQRRDLGDTHRLVCLLLRNRIRVSHRLIHLAMKRGHVLYNSAECSSDPIPIMPQCPLTRLRSQQLSAWRVVQQFNHLHREIGSRISDHCISARREVEPLEAERGSRDRTRRLRVPSVEFHRPRAQAQRQRQLRDSMAACLERVHAR